MKDIEQLKLILEQIGQTTESAKWVAILWMSLDCLKVTIGFIGSLLLAKVILAFIKEIWLKLDTSVTFMHACRDLVIPGQSGSYVTDGERRRVLAVIEKAIQSK